MESPHLLRGLLHITNTFKSESDSLFLKHVFDICELWVLIQQEWYQEETHAHTVYMLYNVVMVPKKHSAFHPSNYDTAGI